MKWGFVFAIVVVVLIAIFAVCDCDIFIKPPPIGLSFRDSMLVSGKVLQVHNTSTGESLICTMTAKSHAANESTTYMFRLRPQEVHEIGVLEAEWSFMPGEEVTVSAEGYSRAIKCTVP